MEQLTLLFTGDIYPGDIAVSPELLRKMSAADYRIGNLEGVMGRFELSEAQAGKTVLPCVSPGCVDFLKSVGLDYVALANNHMFDYGVAGFHGNVEILESAGISYSGAGENLAQARKPHIFEKNNIKTAFVSCAWNGTEARYATENSAGCAPLDEKWLMEMPQKLKQDGIDHVILYVHWGYCGYSYPLPEHRELAMRLAGYGYAAVIGHHNHQMQGLLTVDNSLIAFGLGDFVFAKYRTADGRIITQKGINSESAVLCLTLDKRGILSHDVIFTVQNGDAVELDNRERQQKFFEQISKKLSVTSYERFWKYTVFKRLTLRVLHWINPFNWRHIKPRTFNALVIMIKNIFGKKG
ncbi:MAG TPA: CapA family protein [Phycisphaerae bacterium]|nr:CapA family protein [Phycisphaerae bacterium]